MKNKTRLPNFMVTLHYVKIDGEAQLIESPYYDHYELCIDKGYTPMSFSWRITNKEIYKGIQGKLEEIKNHPHTGQRSIKYKSLRKKFRNLQKDGFFPDLEVIKPNKKLKSK